MAYIAFAVLVALLHVHSGIKRVQKEVSITKREQYLVYMKQEIQLALIVSGIVLVFFLLQNIGIV